jgi:hypothetical protein
VEDDKAQFNFIDQMMELVDRLLAEYEKQKAEQQPPAPPPDHDT